MEATPIDFEKRRLLLACSLLIAVAPPILDYLSTSEIYPFQGVMLLAGLLFALAATISLYRGPMLVAFAGLLLNLLLVVEVRSIALDGEGVGLTHMMIRRGNELGDAIRWAVSYWAAGGFLLLTSLLLLIYILTRQKWAPGRGSSAGTTARFYRRLLLGSE